MNIKLELTKKFLELANIDVTDDNITRYFYNIWKNPRHTGERSFALSKHGYQFLLKKANLKFYKIPIPEDTILTNQLVIWLDKFIDGPYYLTKECIFVSKEKLAIQLILYDGDLRRFGQAKATSEKNHLTSTQISV